MENQYDENSINVTGSERFLETTKAVNFLQPAKNVKDAENLENGCSLKTADEEIYSLILQEEKRQNECLALIASENFASKAVQQAVGTVLMNKYSEGYPGSRYYAGTEVVDKIENLCESRALELYELDPNEWGVVVQALSGSSANLAVYTALLEPNDCILYLSLPDGGHLSHGFQTETKKISAASKYFKTIPYHVDATTGLIDYNEMLQLAQSVKPKIIIAGTSAYSRIIDYSKFRDASTLSQAILLADMAHIAGLVAAKVHPSPFIYADVVTTTTHKTLRGPRGALIFYRRKWYDNENTNKACDYENKIKAAIFPGLQGGPHQHTIAGICVCLKLASKVEFCLYQKQVLRNARVLAEELKKLNFDIVTGTTETHLVLVDLRSKRVSGAKAEKICESANIILNKNSIPGDKSFMNPNGIRLGSAAMTSRGLREEDFKKIAQFIDEALSIAVSIQSRISGAKGLAEFVQLTRQNPPFQLFQLKNQVIQFARRFPLVEVTAFHF